MNTILNNTASYAASALRASLLFAALALPVLAIPSFAGDGGPRIIESSAKPASGAGLVIVVGLQRAR